MNFKAEDYKIFECVTGSRLYGTATPESDLDIRGVCIPPLEVLIDPFNKFEQQDSGFDEDKAIYSLDKFINLCANANPNIIELLFVPKESILFSNEYWDSVMEYKHLFLSKKVKYTFTGYAFSQLNAIKNHRQWFIDPPKEKPTRKMFGLTDKPIVSGENLQNAFNIPHEMFKDEYHDEFVRERNYRVAKQKWDNYVAWRDNRNPKRKELEDRFGYDCKHASHLIRLMTEGKELLLTGNITFPLPNADEILAIKNGKYTYDEILTMAENMDKDFELWYGQSPLPHSPDKKALSKLYFAIIRTRENI